MPTRRGAGRATIERQVDSRGAVTYQVSGTTARGTDFVRGGLTRAQANTVAGTVRAGGSASGRGGTGGAG